MGVIIACHVAFNYLVYLYSGSIGKSVLLFVGAGFLMSMHRYSDQRFPLNSKIHSGSRHPNPPILENTYHLLSGSIGKSVSLFVGAGFVCHVQHRWGQR